MVLSVVLSTALAIPASQQAGCVALADSVVAAVSEAASRTVTLADRLRRTCQSDFSALFVAGQALNRASAGNQNRALRDRAEALLARAVVVNPRHAAAWFEYGVLLKRRGGMPVDAQRALRRAFDLAERNPEATPPRALAEMLLHQARFDQDWVDRLRNLRDGERFGTFTPACSSLGTFCENYTHPAAFNGLLTDAPVIDRDFDQLRTRLLSLYRKILALDPQLGSAKWLYARELALGEEWRALLGLGLNAELPAERLVLALARFRVGEYGLADTLFRTAIPRIHDTVRTWFEQPPLGVGEGETFWRRARPLWLTEINEIELEHWARVAYAVLVFGDSTAGAVGPETVQGQALVRYGWPKRITQVTREGSRVLSASRQYAIEYFLNCVPADAGGDPGLCEVSGAQGTARDDSQGRWIFWTYDETRPSHIFELRSGMRVPRHMRESAAEDYARQVAEATPITFASRLAPSRVDLAVQVVRFRGDTTDRTVVGFLGPIPNMGFAVETADSIKGGLFLFNDAPDLPLVASSTRRYSSQGSITTWLFAPAGRYRYSLELLADARGMSAVARDTLTAPHWAPDRLIMSDILVAGEIRPSTGMTPRTWRDLEIHAPALSADAGKSVHVLWETYGLAQDGRGHLNYRVQFAIRDREGRSLPSRILRGLGVVRPSNEPVIEWQEDQPAGPGGRALNFIEVQIPTEADGKHEISITITEASTGRTTSVRQFLVVRKASSR